jgi:hypothetical protein
MYTREQLEEVGLTDFRVFLVQVWDHLGLPDPTPVQLDIAKALQHGPRRMVVEGFRGVGKSWITVAFVLWNLLLDPQIKIMVVSASQPLADDFSKFCKQLIHSMPLLQHLAPREGQRDSSLSFDVGPAHPSKDPSVKSAGITGQITGSRADIIVADDVEIPKNSFTHHLREKLSEQVKEFDAVLKPEGRVLYLGTPQVEQSLYTRLEKRGYIPRVWPAEIPANPDVYRGNLAPFVLRRIDTGAKPHEPLDPKRFDMKDLMERRASYGASGYALQFMLDTNPSEIDKHPLKLRDLIVYDCDLTMGPVQMVWGNEKELVLQDLQAGGFDGDFYVRAAWKSQEMVKWQGTVMAIDPSGMGSDETGYAIVRYLNGNVFLVDVGGFQEGFSEETLKALAATAIRHRVNWVIDEPNYGGGMFRQLLKPHLIALGGEQRGEDPKHPIAKFDEEWKGWSHTQKELRILDTLEPVMQSHRLIVDRRVVEKDLAVQQDHEAFSLVQQMTRMARVKGALAHEDRLEAVSMAVSYWTERMNRDQNKALKDHKEGQLKLELKKFMKHTIGFVPGGMHTTWRRRK